MRFRLLLAFSALCTPVLYAQAPADPAVLRGTRQTVTMWVPSLRDMAADSQRVTDWVARCGGTAAAMSPRLAPPTAPGGVLAVMVIPRRRDDGWCDDGPGAPLAELWGVQLASDSVRADDAITAVRVLRDGVPVPVAGQEARSVDRLGGDSLQRGRVDAQVVYIALDSLAPSPSGTFGAVHLIVTSAGDRGRDTLVVDPIALRAAWEAALALRVDTRGARSTLRVPVAGDAGIAGAQAEAERGAHGTAVRALSGTWRRPGLTGDDRRAAAAQLGASLYALGDDAGARVAFYALLEEMPCLTLDADVPASLRVLITAVDRPAVRCEEQSLTRTALRAAVMPGFGRPRTPGEPLYRAPVVGLLAAGLVAAVMAEQEARTSYSQYLNYQAEEVDPFVFRRGADYWYRRAERARSLQNNLWLGVGALWVAQGAFAVWQEQRLHRALAAQRGYGRAAPSVGLGLRGAALGVGIAVEVRW